MKKLTIGILAHVDAGKTTLSEALLYLCGAVRQLGRVDKRDTLLDSDSQERARGITIFSKCARFKTENTEFVLLDTPGHVDFGAETERVLSVLDYCVLVVSGTDGVQSHTRTLWKLLRTYHVPTLIFVNKTDMPGFRKDLVMTSITAGLSGAAVDFSGVHFPSESNSVDNSGEITAKNPGNIKNKISVQASDEYSEIFLSASETVLENIAVCDENMLEYFLEDGKVRLNDVKTVIAEEKLFPVYFGSALRLDGVKEFINALDILTEDFYNMKAPIVSADHDSAFSALVYKIGRDESGNRLAFIKILSGKLLPKMQIGEEKVQQLRFYSGDKFKTGNEAAAGDIVCVTGLEAVNTGDRLMTAALYNSLNTLSSMPDSSDSKPSADDTIIIVPSESRPMLEPVMSYRLLLPDGVSATAFLPRLRILEEEDPTLSVVTDEFHGDILIHVMGKVHMEILKTAIKNRFDTDVDFGNGRIIYKETIASRVEGIGHFEPLRHYAEAHVMLEPLPRGSGIVIDNNCPTDILSSQYQKQVLSALATKKHRGVLTGSFLTDVKITLLSGKSHVKHTEGGDFRQAANRAVRQGLRQADSVLLEPYYAYTLELPTESVGRAMTELEIRGASFEANNEQDEAGLPDGISMLSGYAPASEMADYGLEVTAYTKGLGKLSLVPAGYRECHNAEEVIASFAYDPDADLRNPSSSVFCSHGSGINIPWDEAERYMHLPYTLKERVNFDENGEIVERFHYRGSGDGSEDSFTYPDQKADAALGTDDVDEILNRTFYANSGRTVKNAAARSIERRDAQSEADDALEAFAKTAAKSKTPVYKGTEKPYIPEDSYLLIDGYNVVFAWKELNELAAVNIDGARGRLLDMLCNFQARKGMNLIVVFDAYRVKDHDTEYFDYNNIHVVYTKTAETADRYIERFATDFGRKYHVRVVTSDGAMQVIIRGNGCVLTSSREFEEEVQKTDSDISDYIEGRIF